MTNIWNGNNSEGMTLFRMNDINTEGMTIIRKEGMTIMRKEWHKVFFGSNVSPISFITSTSHKEAIGFLGYPIVLKLED